MNFDHSTDSRMGFSDRMYRHCLQKTRNYLKTNPFIRNRDLRHIAGIGYDQAIMFFNQALATKTLTREGISSGTRYRLRERENTASIRKARNRKKASACINVPKRSRQ
jgi:hypothetical protein